MISKQFEKLGAKRRKVLIAQDILLRLKLGTYVAKTGSYTHIIKGNDYDTRDKSAQEAIKNKQIKCEVCARGGIFLSSVVFKNSYNIGELDDVTLGSCLNETPEDRFIEEDWTEEELDRIECAFEEEDVHGNLEEDVIDLCVEFGKQARDKRKMNSKESNRAILTCIMQNIIDNKGVFKPEIIYEY